MLPKSYYQAKKILYPMGMEYQKRHACPNDCILYKYEYEEMHKFPRCEVSRYKVKVVLIVAEVGSLPFFLF